MYKSLWIRDPKLFAKHNFQIIHKRGKSKHLRRATVER